MKLFHHPVRDTLYFSYRMVRPIIDPIHLVAGIFGYAKFIRDVALFKQKDPKARLLGMNLFPIVEDNSLITRVDSHYYYQQIWAFGRILKERPAHHVDIGSSYEFSAYVSFLCKTEFVDIRPIESTIRNLKIVRGDITNLPYPDNSVSSLSSLHVIEHVGLGRYGDPIDPPGSERACREIVRVVKPGAHVYISVPVGKSRICFNAHRIFSPKTIVRYCRGLKFYEFSLIDDRGRYVENTQITHAEKLDYGCGLFHFIKK